MSSDGGDRGQRGRSIHPPRPFPLLTCRTRIPIAKIIFIPLCANVLLCRPRCHNKGGDVSPGLSVDPYLINTVCWPLTNSLRGGKTAFQIRLCITWCLRRRSVRFTIRFLPVCTSDVIYVFWLLVRLLTVFAKFHQVMQFDRSPSVPKGGRAEFREKLTVDAYVRDNKLAK